MESSWKHEEKALRELRLWCWRWQLCSRTYGQSCLLSGRRSMARTSFSFGWQQQISAVTAIIFASSSALPATGHSRLSLFEQGWKILFLRQQRKLVPGFDGEKHGKTQGPRMKKNLCSTQNSNRSCHETTSEGHGQLKACCCSRVRARHRKPLIGSTWNTSHKSFLKALKGSWQRKKHGKHRLPRPKWSSVPQCITSPTGCSHLLTTQEKKSLPWSEMPSKS